jgi:rhodanese-related sulfurtransferase
MCQIGLPDAPYIVDVRLPEDIGPTDRIIPTARQHDYRDTAAIIAALAGRKAVVLCHKGLKLSQGIAALIRANGGQAEVLTGGFVAWQEHFMPDIPCAQLPHAQVWVTRQRPKIDRIACPWLITRFIAPDAQFMFVPRNDVMTVAERFGAIAFNVPDATYTHQDEKCSFDAILDGFNLRTDALNRMADVIRAADTDRLDQIPQAAGLLAVSVGLSKQYRDDNAMLAAGFPIYAALYRWARDGFSEGHAE